MSHQSNGRGGSLSRSWNRIYTNFVFEKENFVVSLKPWWRIPEDEKEDPLDASGDDNPDITDYMGNFELTTLYRRHDHEFSLMLRNNLEGDNYGAVQLEWTFPLWRGVRGYAQYFNGYGESLIDYDAHIERFGIGILLTDLL
jgi:phospholipase A1